MTDVLAAQSRPTLCTLLDCSPLGSSVHGILQARMLEGLPFPSPGIRPGSPPLQVASLLSEPPRKPNTDADIFFFNLFYFTILYWFCHTSAWICHWCTWVPNPEAPSHLPPHIISLGHPSTPAPSILYPVSNLDWWFVSYMIVYMFQCHSPKSSHPLPLPQSPLFKNIYLLIYLFCLYLVLAFACRLSLVAISGDYSLVAVHRLLMWWLLLLQSTSPRYTPASAVVVNRFNYHVESSQTGDQTCVSCIDR